MAGAQRNLTLEHVNTIRIIATRARAIKLDLEREIQEATIVRQPNYIQLHMVDPDLDRNGWMDHEELQGWIVFQGIYCLLACVPNCLMATKTTLEELFICLFPTRINLDPFKERFVEIHNEMEDLANSLLEAGFARQQGIDAFNLKFAELQRETSIEEFFNKVNDYYNTADDCYEFLNGVFQDEQEREQEQALLDEQEQDKPETKAPFYDRSNGNISQRQLDITKIRKDTDADIPDALLCPISREIMSTPVMLFASGMTYEKEMIERWLESNSTDPETGSQITSFETQTNWHCKRQVNKFIEDYKKRNASPVSIQPEAMS